jgi:hypothetical protein
LNKKLEETILEYQKVNKKQLSLEDLQTELFSKVDFTDLEDLEKEFNHVELQYAL